LLSDVYTSLAVLAGMLVIYVGERLGVRQLMILDPLIALVIAVMVARAGWSVTRRAVGHLLDAAIPPDQQRAITALLDEHYPQFVEYHALRSRKAGSQTFIDLHLVVPPNLPVLDAHDLADHLEQDIRLLVANAEVMIHVEPGPLGRADSSKEEETE
jgi:cation diffusion facilitator family transporter